MNVKGELLSDFRRLKTNGQINASRIIENDNPACILSSCLYGVFSINIEIGMCMIGVDVLLLQFERVFDAGHFFYKCLINFQTLVYRIAAVNDC